MYINKIGVLICIAGWLVLLAPVTTLGIPVPTLESQTETSWENAWEGAWKIAWESAWKSVAPAAVPGVEQEADVAGIWGIDPAATLQEAGFDLIWGAPLFSTPDSSLAENAGPTPIPEAAAAPNYGKLYIQVQPTNAAVSLRGVDTAYNQGMTLPPGTYIADIRKSGYLTQTRRIDLLSGMAATLDVTLTPKRSADKATRPGQLPEAATQAQLVKKLFTPQASGKAPARLSASADTTPPLAQIDAQQAVPAQGALYVSTEPPDAKVRILQIKPIFHQGIQLAPGRYTIDAAREGFERTVSTVEIAPDQDTRVHLALEKALPKGKLFVRTEPAGAKVRILNIKPVFHQGIELGHGEYLLDAQLDGYKTVTHKIKLTPGEEKNVTLSLPKAPPTGRLYVLTTPAKARVRVLHIKPKFEQGLSLKAGEYTIDVQHKGYAAQTQKIRIVPKADNNITVDLQKITPKGRLFVRTDPAGAKVRILNIKPKFMQGMELKQGEYTIDAQLDGYRTEIKKVRVASDRDNKITLKLAKAPEKGKLFVSTTPGGARVRILHIKPVFHQGIELSPGSYTIDAQLPGHETAVARVGIAPGEETHFALALDPTRQPQETDVSQPLPQVPAADFSESAALPEPVELPKKDVAAYDVDAFVTMAVLAVNAGNYEDAIKAGDRALALDPECAEALKVKGDALLLMEKYDAAITQYDKALSLKPKDKQIRVNKAYAFEQLEKKVEALKATETKTTKATAHQKSKVPHQFALDN